MAGTLTVTEEGQTIQLNIAAVGQAGASDVSKLTAAGMAAGSYLRVTASEGLEERTAAEVLGDIGADHAVITEATAGRTLALTDSWCYIRCTNSGAITITVPQETSVAWVAGTEIYFRRASGAGAISLAGGGVAINNGSASTSVDANGTFCIKKVGTDTWDLI